MNRLIVVLSFILLIPLTVFEETLAKAVFIDICYNAKMPKMTDEEKGKYYGDTLPYEIRKVFVDSCREYGVPIEIAYGIGKRESRWRLYPRDNPNSNSTFDIGPMQINNANIDEFSWKYFEGGKDEKFNIRNPRHNVQVGIAYLSSMYRAFGRDWIKAIMAYNVGPTRIANGSLNYFNSPILKNYVDEVITYYKRSSQ